MMRILVPLAAAAVLSAGAATPGTTASARLQPTVGNTTSGEFHFTQRGNTVLVTGEVRGLPPNSEHGFHVHEKGDCSGGDGMSAGGHFNPMGRMHGAYNSSEHHAGDLPSLKADANGVARLNFESASVALGSGTNDIVGRGLIVHRDPDDFKTQPTGNSGPRLACAVITRP